MKEELVFGSSSAESFCDEEIPKRLVEPVYKQIAATFSDNLFAWRLTKSEVIPAVPKGHWTPPPSLIYKWEGKGNAKLMYADFEMGRMCCLDDPTRGVAAVVGSCGEHPFIQCNTFGYGNSDGSSP